MTRSSILMVIAAFLILAGCSCRPGDTAYPGSTTIGPGDSIQARLVVSVDFGEMVFIDEDITVNPGTTALGALSQHANVDTAYGGGFVKSIEGVTSGYMARPATRNDWFLYINGILTNTGGMAYGIQPGDTVHWYYRDWSFRQSVSSIIGDYPEPFVHGYGGNSPPVLVLFEDGYQQVAEDIVQGLRSRGTVSVLSSTLEKVSSDKIQNSNLILIGSKDFALIAEINSLWDKLGLFARFYDGRLETYHSDGTASVSYSSGAGAIMVMQNPFNPRGTGACESVCMVVTGTDPSAIRSAAHILGDYNGQVKYLASAIVHNDEIIALP